MGLFGVSQKKAEQFEGAAPTVHGISELLRKAAAEGAVLLKMTALCPLKQAAVFRFSAEFNTTGFTPAMAPEAM